MPHRRVRAALVGAAACLIALASIVSAQTRRPMTLVDLIEVPRVSDPQLSPDGRQVALHDGQARLEGEPARGPHLAHQRWTARA